MMETEAVANSTAVASSETVANSTAVASSETVARLKARTVPSAPCVTFTVNEKALTNDAIVKVFGPEVPNEYSKFVEGPYNDGEHKKITIGRDDDVSDFVLNIRGVSRIALQIALVYKPGESNGCAIEVVNLGRLEIGLYEGMARRRGIKHMESFLLKNGAIISICNGQMLLEAKTDLAFVTDFRETTFTVVLEMDTRNTVSVTRLSNEVDG